MKCLIVLALAAVAYGASSDDVATPGSGPAKQRDTRAIYFSDYPYVGYPYTGYRSYIADAPYYYSPYTTSVLRAYNPYYYNYYKR